MTLTQAEPRESLLALVRAFVDHPDKIELWEALYGGRDRVQWKIRCHGADMPKLIGSKGSHIQALQRLFRVMGKLRGFQYFLEVEEPADQHQNQPTKPVPAKSFAAEPTLCLLLATLEALGLRETPVHVQSYPPEATGAFILVKIGIRAKGQDWDALVEMAGNGVSVIGALGTIFRAIGHKQGVKIMLEAVPQ